MILCEVAHFAYFLILTWFHVTLEIVWSWDERWRRFSMYENEPIVRWGWISTQIIQMTESADCSYFGGIAPVSMPCHVWSLRWIIIINKHAYDWTIIEQHSIAITHNFLIISLFCWLQELKHFNGLLNVKWNTIWWCQIKVYLEIKIFIKNRLRV